MTVLFSKTMVKSFGAVQIEPCVLAHVMLFASLVLVDGTIEMCVLERGQFCARRSTPRRTWKLSFYLSIMTVLQLTGDYAGMLRAAEYAATCEGAVPVWMGPWDCMLLALHPTVARAMFAGTGGAKGYRPQVIR